MEKSKNLVTLLNQGLKNFLHDIIQDENKAYIQKLYQQVEAINQEIDKTRALNMTGADFLQEKSNFFRRELTKLIIAVNDIRSDNNWQIIFDNEFRVTFKRLFYLYPPTNLTLLFQVLQSAESKFPKTLALLKTLVLASNNKHIMEDMQISMAYYNKP